jgi:hypothetical protein
MALVCLGVAEYEQPQRIRKPTVRSTGALPIVKKKRLGRAVKHIATRDTQFSFWLRNSHGPSKISSKAVVALLPFTVLATRVKTPPEL